MKLNKFYFNTGVRPTLREGSEIISIKLFRDQVWKGGTKQIPFECEAPEGSVLMFCCDIPDLPESKIDGVIVCEIFNSSIISKYAYMKEKSHV
jgi:hypothetical protein